MLLLEKSVLATLALYEFLKSAPTAFELWQRLVNITILANMVMEDAMEDAGDAGLALPKTSSKLKKAGLGKQGRVNLGQIKELLDSGQVGRVRVGQHNGFYFLPGSYQLAQERSRRIQESQRKISLAKRRLKKVLPWSPFIEGIALEGSVAEGRAKKTSDIDLLVICQNGRIWTARAVFDRLLFGLGWRREGDQLTQDRFCLNHYLTPRDLRTEPGLYHAFLHSHLLPLYEARSGLWRQFLQANSWVSDFLPNFGLSQAGAGSELVLTGTPFSKKITETLLGSPLGVPIENLNRSLQKRIIQRNPLTYQKGGRIRADDKQLEFHPVLIEKTLRQALVKRLAQLGAPIH